MAKQKPSKRKQSAGCAQVLKSIIALEKFHKSRYAKLIGVAKMGVKGELPALRKEQEKGRLRKKFEKASQDLREGKITESQWEKIRDKYHESAGIGD